MGELPRTEEGQVAVTPTAAEMAEQTVREDMAKALEKILVKWGNLHPDDRALARLALDRHRAEPEEPCTAACDNPAEAHCVDHCPCYQEGQRERVGEKRK